MRRGAAAGDHYYVVRHRRQLQYQYGVHRRAVRDPVGDYLRANRDCVLLYLQPVFEEEKRAGRRAGNHRRQLSADAGDGCPGGSFAGDVRGCRHRAAGDGEHYHHDHRADTGRMV